MAELELRFLGDLDVLRDGVSLGLPPSRKTRALLAYLALHPRGFRRDHLCDLFWEVPDDPRGALRWSLSKLRRLVDDPDRRRLVADRSWVRFDAADTVIDVAMLDALACSEFRDASLEELESAAARCRGEFLAGLDLPGLHDFHVWCAAERERIARARAGLLSALVARLGDEPDRALPYARTLVGLLPYDQTVRAGLIRMLMATGRTDEAEQHFRLGLRMNEEVGAPPSGALYQARRGMPVRTLETGAPLDGPVQTPADRPLPGASKLVGRDAEIRWLNDAFSRVTSEGRAAAVLLKGDAGIGKSCLLELAGELARGADAFVLEASAFEAEVARPFALWIDAFRRCEPGSGAELFDGVPPDRDRLLSALSERLTGEAERRPVVLIFDDLQWGDDSSAAALHYVTRMNRHQPLLAVLAARPDDRAENPGVQQALRGLRHDGLLEELRLGPLPPAAVRELIEMHAPTVDSRALSRECGGNPLMAIELARAGTAGASGGSLDELVRERLGRLDSSEQEVLRWAAVLAPRIDVGTLVRITGMDWAGVGDALERGERQAILLSTDESFRFSHDLVARSVYEDIAPARRRVMHRHAAELLEQATAVDLEHAADLAHHAAHSGDPALAARAMVSAGRLCLRFFANDDAANLARKGLELLDRLPEAERVCLTLDLRDILLTAAPLDDWQAAAEEYVELAERALDHGALAHARLGYHLASYVRWEHGQWAGAREETLQAERVARTGDGTDHVVGMAETAKCLAMLERDLSHADAMVMEASALAARQSVSHHAIPMALGMLRYHEDNLDQAEELFKEARTLCKTAGDRLSEYQANEYLVMIALERGNLDAARTWCRMLIEIGDKLREGSEGPFARALAGLCAYALADERDRLEAAIGELRLVDAKHRLAYTLTRAAELDLERGRCRDALARAQEALACAEALQRTSEMLLAHGVLARACDAVGDASGGEQHRRAIAALEVEPVAQWARARAAAVAARPSEVSS